MSVDRDWCYSKFDLQLLVQGGSTYYSLSRSIRRVRCAWHWDLKQATNKCRTDNGAHQHVDKPSRTPADGQLAAEYTAITSLGEATPNEWACFSLSDVSLVQTRNYFLPRSSTPFLACVLFFPRLLIV